MNPFTALGALFQSIYQFFSMTNKGIDALDSLMTYAQKEAALFEAKADLRRQGDLEEARRDLAARLAATP